MKAWALGVCTLMISVASLVACKGSGGGSGGSGGSGGTNPSSTSGTTNPSTTGTMGSTSTSSTSSSSGSGPDCDVAATDDDCAACDTPMACGMCCQTSVQTTANDIFIPLVVDECGCKDATVACNAICAADLCMGSQPAQACIDCLNGELNDAMSTCANAAVATCMADPDCNPLLVCLSGC